MCVCELQYGKPVTVAVSSNVFTSKKNNVSIGSASRGTEMATVSWAIPSLSETFTAVSTYPTVIAANKSLVKCAYYYLTRTHHHILIEICILIIHTTRCDETDPHVHVCYDPDSSSLSWITIGRTLLYLIDVTTCYLHHLGL